MNLLIFSLIFFASGEFSYGKTCAEYGDNSGQLLKHECNKVELPGEKSEFSNIACDCRDCDDTNFHACSRGDTIHSDIKKTGCYKGECKPCKPIGATCKNDVECCDAWQSIYLTSQAVGICNQMSSKCSICAPKYQPCGKHVPCCDTLKNPTSQIQCRETSGGRYRCLDNSCSQQAKIREYKCTGVDDDFLFCRCPKEGSKEQQYYQCKPKPGEECRKCVLKGQKCDISGEECCQDSLMIAPPKQRMEYSCINGTCQHCFKTFSKSKKGQHNCLTQPKIPCCTTKVGLKTTKCQLEGKYATCK